MLIEKFIMFNLENKKPNKSAISNFFYIVPRGECLDLFLELIKYHCIGDDEYQKFYKKIEELTDKFTENGIVNWNKMYHCDEYKICMNSFFSLFFNHIKNDNTPIPALNYQINKKYQPQRINKFLKYMRKIWILDNHKS